MRGKRSRAAASSWNCKGCTNLCHLSFNGKVGTYCRVYYDQPDHKGRQWIDDDTIVCLDYTTDPEAEDTQVRFWHPPEYEVKVFDYKGAKR